jgi:hypothetical protein
MEHDLRSNDLRSDPCEPPKVVRDYRWRCDNIDGYRERYNALCYASYRRRKDADPDAYNERKNAYWGAKYKTDEAFRAKVLQAAKARRLQRRLAKEQPTLNNQA